MVGGTAPAMPQQADRGGKEARGKIIAGLALELARISIPMLGNTELGQEIASFVAKIGRRLSKPPQDLGQSELKFMGSQLWPPAQSGGADGAARPAMPPPPPPPPQAPAEAAA